MTINNFLTFILLFIVKYSFFIFGYGIKNHGIMLKKRIIY
jgi:hypothetical protein